MRGLLDARMPFPADPQGGLEDRDRRGDGGGSPSSTSASASASGSRLRMRRSLMHRRTLGVPAELVVERLVCFQAGGRSAQHPLLKRPKAIPQRHCLVKATQLVLQRNPHGIRLVYLPAGGEPLGKLVDDLIADI